MDEQKTTIVVESSDPPPQPIGHDEPYGVIVAPLSGHRDEDAALDWTAVEVNTTTYEPRLRDTFKPRFRGEVKDHLSGKPESTLSVDVTFSTTTQHWPAQLLESVPEMAAVEKMIRQLEHLKRHLSQQVAIRNRLEALLGATIEPADKD